MITVYVIESETDAVRYTGMAKNVLIRLKEHNVGKNRFTKGHRPWKIIYTETYSSWSEARVREKYLKTNAGKIWLNKFLQQNGGKTGSLPA
jgi:putative endonuclease